MGVEEKEWLMVRSRQDRSMTSKLEAIRFAGTRESESKRGLESAEFSIALVTICEPRQRERCCEPQVAGQTVA